MKKRILVIDDDYGILEVIKIILEEQDYSVDIASDKASVSFCFAKKIPDLIILDIWMSGIDGQRITRKLKKEKLTSKIPVIMVSANQNTEQIAKESGADNFLSKPFNIADLTALVNSYLKK